MSKIPLLMFVLLCTASQVFAADQKALVGDPAAGQTKAEVCTACHGTNGNSPTPLWPKIAGLSEKYLYSQLIEFRKGDKGLRNDPTMYGIVQHMSDQDLADLAAFYARQKMTVGTVAQNFVEVGQKVYRGGNIHSGVPACAACHDATGKGNALANFPRLSGQNPQYVIDQLTKFKTKVRKNDPNGMMEDIAARLTEQEIEAVANYVSALH